MFHRFLSLFAVLFFSAVALADECVPSQNRFASIPINGALKQVARNQVNNTQVRITVAGTIVINDGCSFTVSNFTFLNGPTKCMWYATAGACSNADAAKLSETVVTSILAQNATYQLTNVVGREMTWNTVDCIKLYCEDQQLVVAQAQLVDPSSPNASTNSNGESSGLPKAVSHAFFLWPAIIAGIAFLA